MLVLFLLYLPMLLSDLDSAARARTYGKLLTLAGAMHKYEESHGTLPPAAIYDHEGKPLLSWRVAILPYIGEGELYRQFRLDEPWDSPANKPLLERMPDVFKAPRNHEDFKTYYRVFHGPGAAFEGQKGIPYSKFEDGLSGTILIVVAHEAVPWTKPDELEYHPDGPLPQLGGVLRRDERFQAIMADDSSPGIRKHNNEQLIRATITRSGGENLPEDRSNW